MRGLTLKELIAWTPPAYRNIIDKGILVAGTKMVILGRYESWKSMLAIHTSYCIAMGRPWFGYKTIKSPVYNLQTEIPQPEVRERLIKYAAGNTVDCENVWWANELFVKVDKGGVGRSELERELARTKAQVLVIDALYKVVSGHLVDEYDMRQFVDQMDILIKQYGVAIIIVHHPRKQQLYEGQIIDMGGEDSLGSFLINWCDTCIKLTKDTQDDTLVSVSWAKTRHASERLMPFAFRARREDLTFKRIDYNTT